LNQLANETSPYLLQHKNNPVNWYPYTTEVLDKAKTKNMPIFLSIGYSSCHWCHVMARESFEDEKTANYMNENFINIKVDREERPGLDKVYQELYQMINHRGGGWPLSVWMLPDGRPFFIGTYFPDQPRHNMPSFMQLNERIKEIWKNESDKLEQQAEAITQGIENFNNYLLQSTGELTQELYNETVNVIQERFDNVWGGIGSAPKFPMISTLQFLLQEGIKQEKRALIDFVEFTFFKMAYGGIYDQIGGGLARYSVDNKWLVPHFEKMLYDNGAFLSLAADLYTLTKNNEIKNLALHTISWLTREMKDEKDRFWASLNAESEGQEGKFYVWFETELKELLKDDYKVIKEYYGVTEVGNFKDPHHPEINGMNVIFINKNYDKIAKESNLPVENVKSIVKAARNKMFEYREKRIKPDLDDKIITSWNCLVIDGLLKCAEAFNNDAIGKLAISSLNSLIDVVVTEERVLRYYKETYENVSLRKLDGAIDDYSFLINVLISGFEYTDNWQYIQLAEKIQDLLDDQFFDAERNVYYSISKTSEEGIIGRTIQIMDDGMASGLGVQLRNLFKLGKYLEKDEFVKIGEKIIKNTINKAKEFPGAMSEYLISSNYYLNYPFEIVILGSGELDQSYFEKYIPQKLVYRWNNQNDGRPKWEVTEQRELHDKETIYICEGMTCSLPLKTKKDVDNFFDKKINIKS
jgi:uncharacterized protein